jgi:hypothetical protein
MPISTIGSDGINQAADTLLCTTSGNVGIGTSSPTMKLDISGTSYGGLYIKSTSTNFSGVLLENTNSATKWQIGVEGGLYNTAGKLNIGIDAVGPKLIIDSSGNVGIGTSSPVAKLGIVGGTSNASSLATAYSLAAFNITPKSTSGYSLQFGSGPSDVPYIQMSAGGSAAGDLTIQPYGGNLLVGTTSNSLSTKLFVSGSIGAQQTYGPMYYSNENNTDNVGRGSFNFQRGGSTVGQIVTTNSTCAYNSVSDYRLKENIAPMIGALGKVAQLKPCTFTWKSNSFIGQGFIAHELQEVVPDCVAGEKDAVDAEGKPVYQGVDTIILGCHIDSRHPRTQSIGRYSI